MSQKLTLPGRICVGTNFIDFHFPPTHTHTHTHDRVSGGREVWKSVRYDQENKLSALPAIAYN